MLEQQKYAQNERIRLDFSCIDFASGQVTANGINGVSIITEGEAKGHGVWIDAQFLQAIVASANGKRVRAFRVHNDGWLDNDPLQNLIGYFENFRLDGSQVRADYVAVNNQLDAGWIDKILTYAKEAPEIIATSIEFISAGLKPESETNNEIGYPHILHYETTGVAYTTFPAANPSGMFNNNPTNKMEENNNQQQPADNNQQPVENLELLQAQLAEQQKQTTLLEKLQAQQQETKQLAQPQDEPATEAPEEPTEAERIAAELAAVKEQNEKLAAQLQQPADEPVNMNQPTMQQTGKKSVRMSVNEGLELINEGRKAKRDGDNSQFRKLTMSERKKLMKFATTVNIAAAVNNLDPRYLLEMLYLTVETGDIMQFMTMLTPTGLQGTNSVEVRIPAAKMSPVIKSGNPCTVTEDGQLDITSRSVTAVPFHIPMSFCPQEQFASLLNGEVYAGDDSLPFEALMLDLFMQEVAKEFARLFLVGDTGGGDLLDGLATQFKADANIPAGPAPAPDQILVEDYSTFGLTAANTILDAMPSRWGRAYEAMIPWFVPYGTANKYAMDILLNYSAVNYQMSYEQPTAYNSNMNVPFIDSIHLPEGATVGDVTGFATTMQNLFYVFDIPNGLEVQFDDDIFASKLKLKLVGHAGVGYGQSEDILYTTAP